MVSLLGGLVGVVVTKSFLITCGCGVRFRGDYVAMSICVICWLGWYICVHS